MNKACVVEACEKPVIARGCCPSHYNRMRRTGSPHPAPRRGVRPIEDRFWEKVEKTETCWNWTAGRNADGYGIFHNKAIKAPTAHRTSWEIANGPIPERMEIDHTCHNRGCVNPSHMRLASRAENNQHLSGVRKNNKSGYRGVSWHAGDRNWRACVVANKVTYNLGGFSTAEEAAVVAQAKRKELFAYNNSDR
jgi:hypothetical protein